MSKQKFRIQVIDFLPMHGKVKTNIHDESGEPLCVGDAIENNGRKMLIGYRYGKFALIPMFSAHYMVPGPEARYKKLNEVCAATGTWLIIGYDDEPLYQEVKDLEDIQVG